VSAPLLRAARIFSLIPPTGITLPVKESSPVMANLDLTGVLSAKLRKGEAISYPLNQQSDGPTDLIKAVAMAAPADGPSFSTAPSGT
jgi:hypothetical protein